MQGDVVTEERSIAEQVLIDVVMRRLVAGRHHRAVVAGQVLGCLRAGVAPAYVRAVDHMERERALRYKEAEERIATAGRATGKQGSNVALVAAYRLAAYNGYVSLDDPHEVAIETFKMAREFDRHLTLAHLDEAREKIIAPDTNIHAL